VARVVVSFEDETETHEILAGLQEGVLVVDLSERVARANEVAARLCGISLGELVGARLDALPEGVRAGPERAGRLARASRRCSPPPIARCTPVRARRAAARPPA
jgi:PAS domain-containing protein